MDHMQAIFVSRLLRDMYDDAKAAYWLNEHQPDAARNYSQALHNRLGLLNEALGYEPPVKKVKSDNG